MFSRVIQLQFQCSSASRKFLNQCRDQYADNAFVGFSALQRAENSSMYAVKSTAPQLATVSVLFSEPKIPQFGVPPPRIGEPHGFSALQRAENSSMALHGAHHLTVSPVSVLFSEPKIPQSDGRVALCDVDCRFQCSSASRKFLNGDDIALVVAGNGRFSALQRAENSSIHNPLQPPLRLPGFSALQRAENSSMWDPYDYNNQAVTVSVLFSEPKIPQLNPVSLPTA